MNEQQLIYALQNGQEPAFRLLVERYKDRLYHTILGFIPVEEDAEDVLQDVFIKVFENIATFKAESMLGTWMYRIAVTQSLDAIRKKKRKKRAAAAMSWFGITKDVENIAVEYTHPGVLAENKERSVQLFRAMQNLSGNQRAAFILQKIEGLSQQDIAEVLEVSIGALESLLSRAKQNLKQTLSTYYYEE